MRDLRLERWKSVTGNLTDSMEIRPKCSLMIEGNVTSLLVV